LRGFQCFHPSLFVLVKACAAAGFKVPASAQANSAPVMTKDLAQKLEAAARENPFTQRFVQAAIENELTW